MHEGVRHVTGCKHGDWNGLHAGAPDEDRKKCEPECEHRCVSWNAHDGSLADGVGLASGPVLSQCRVDALDVLRASETGFNMLSTEQLAALAASFEGDFLENLAVDGSPAFAA
jgi:hypothetical protein